MKVTDEVSASAAEDEAVAVQILDRNDEPATFGDDQQPVTISVIGMNSPSYAKNEAWSRKQYRALGARLATPAEELEIFCGFLARCCRGWAGFFDERDAPIPFSTENATDLLLKLGFVRRQVQSAVGNARRFGQKTASG